MPTKSTPDYDIVEFATPKLFEKWLAKNHNKAPGVWLRMFKKDSGIKSIHYAEALDVALCYGWIDGQSKRENDLSYVQKFTPRRARSLWSKINRGHIARLIEEGKMKPAGLAQVEAAKADGRWDAATDSPTSMTEPPDFLKALKKNKTAHAFYKTLNKRNTYAMLFQIQTAKREETRQRRIEKFVEMCANGEKLY
jgi:uncharacterized protein YdeI (YjbR/CyaY-like superfamily)